jgi:hypothetical protein
MLRTFNYSMMVAVTVVLLGGGLSLSGCQSNEGQNVIDADIEYGVTQNRVIKYVSLPTCGAATPVDCLDPAVKQQFKDAANMNLQATTSAGINAANSRYLAILDANNINCGPEASDTCP